MSARVLAIVVGAGGLAASWGIGGGVYAGEHERYDRAFRRALQLDARLDEEIAECRIGTVTHFDGLVRVWDEARTNREELGRVPAWVTGDDRAALLAGLARYGEALDDKGALVERFKTEQAVLRNSLRALPRTTELLLAELPPGPASAPVEALLADVLVLVVSPSEARERKARCGVRALAGDADPACGVAPPYVVPPALADPLASVTRHATLVIERHAAVEEILAGLTALPVARLAHEAHEVYTRAHAVAVRRAAARRWWAAGAAVALGVGIAAWIITRLQTSARALRETTARLEVALAQIRHERDREAELANLKSRFVAMTSHEFRTPLSVILSSAELLAAYGASWDESRRMKHVGRIGEVAREMSRMLDRVLVIGKADAGMLAPSPGPLRLGALALAVAEEMREVVGPERRLDLVDDAPEDEVWMDERLLRHILTNLLGNAFKYSEGAVRFVVRRDGDDAVFEVADAGIGIPPDELGTLFEAFHRCSNATGFPGTGLGLAVVKKSVEAHGGTIAVESELGRGTRFVVRVPSMRREAA
ncbi:MAG: DAHL domain-containing protein [Myxococcota bacterium]